MDDLFRFGSFGYCISFLLLLFARTMDFLSTWVATPNLVLEGNPIAKKLGWHWGIPLNVVICLSLSFSGQAAIVVSTTSLLVAARNFQVAWLMRSMGEEAYRDWHVTRLQETPITLFLACLAGNTLLTAAVGAGLIFFSGDLVIPICIGMGIIAYATAIALFTLLAVWRNRRATRKQLQREAVSTPTMTDDGSGFVK